MDTQSVKHSPTEVPSAHASAHGVRDSSTEVFLTDAFAQGDVDSPLEILSTDASTQSVKDSSREVPSTHAPAQGATDSPIEALSTHASAKGVTDTNTEVHSPHTSAQEVTDCPKVVPSIHESAQGVTDRPMEVSSTEASAQGVTDSPMEVLSKEASAQGVTDRPMEVSSTEASAQGVTDSPMEVLSKETSAQGVTDRPMEVSSTEASAQGVTDSPMEGLSKEESAQGVTDRPTEVSSTEASAQGVTDSPMEVLSKQASALGVTDRPIEVSSTEASAQGVTDSPMEVLSKEASALGVTDRPMEVSSTEASAQGVTDSPLEVLSKEASALGVTDRPMEISSTEASAQGVTDSPMEVLSKEASAQGVAKPSAFVSAAPQSVAGSHTDVPSTYASDEILNGRDLVWLKNNLGKNWRDLARYLQLENSEIYCIEKDYKSDGEGEIIYQMLLTWKNKHGNESLVEDLCTSLRKVGHKDLAIKLLERLPGSYHATINTANNDSTSGIFSQVVQCMQQKYEALTMKGMPWRTDTELKLKKYHIKINACRIRRKNNCFEHMLMEDILKDSQVPQRIMIQGGPGSGKTTVANKIAYDWAVSSEKRFELVIMLSAIDCAENFEHALIQTISMPELDADKILYEIENKKVLLLIDDYERITDKAELQLLPIIRKQRFSHATVVVLSRSSKLTSSKGEFRQTANKTRCSGVDMTHFLDKHIVLTGLSDVEQDEFIRSHTQDVSATEQEEIFRKVKQVIDIWRSEYFQHPTLSITPLELLLLSVVFTDFRKEKLSLTAIHAELYTMMVCRYHSKEGLPYPKNINLSDISRFEIVQQLGQFAVNVLSLPKYPFACKEVLKKYDSYEVLDLGFVTEVPEVDGIGHKLLYTPLNYALMEFAAANHFKAKKPESQTTWKPADRKKLLSMRPRLITTSPLWFSFLVGVFGNDKTTVFKMLEDFGAEYSHCFGSLSYSLLETPLEEDLQIAIYPLLPVLWDIPWKSNVDFSNSSHHAELLRCGLDSGKIKMIRLDVRYSAKFSADLEVERLMLTFKPHTQAWSTWERNLSCKELHCLISGEYDKNADSHWDEMLRRILQVKCTYMSFEVKEESAHSLLPLICKEILNGRLKDKEIHWMLCDIHEKKRDLIQNINRLLKENKVGGVLVALCGQKKTLPNPGTYRRTSHVVNGNIVELITAAAQSKRLKRFVLINWVEHITIDLADLCHVPKSCGHDPKSCLLSQKSCIHSKKSWKWVQLIGIRVECTKCTECPKSKIQSLDLTHAYLSKETATYLMKHFKIKSLASNMALVTSADEESPILKSLKGLDVKVDESVYDKKHTGSLRKLEKLQILSITMATLDSNKPPLPLKSWIVGSHNFLKLKGIEIWGAEINPQLAMNIIKSLVECVMGTYSLGDMQHLHRSPSMPPLKLKLKYFLINIGQDENAIAKFVEMVHELKPILKQKLLPRLEIVCLDSVLEVMSTVKPNGCTSWVDVFPVEEGFYIRHDFWGMSVEGPFRSREIYNSCPGVCNRFCISASKEAIND